MKKCKVLIQFETSWGTVAILDFFDPTHVKLGDKLENSNGCRWIITGITRGKPDTINYENLGKALYVFDCTVKQIDHDELLVPGNELTLIPEE